MIPLFDLHCDTLLELYKKKENFKDNSLHISLKKLQNYSVFLQIGAIWSDHRLNDNEAYFNCLNVINYVKTQGINVIDNLNSIEKYNFILSVEDARLLNYDLNRLDTLYSHGVRVLTLNWKNNSCIGGAWNTSCSLTNFGKDVIRHACKLGITIDLSHSSLETFWNAIEICDKLGFSTIASHSNSFSLCNHQRNLNDDQIKKLSSLHGLIGISLVPEHLGSCANIDTVIKQVEHFLELGSENCLCLGCDFDGTDSLPCGINSVEDLPLLFDKIKTEFGNKIAKKIFFENAYNFFKKNLRKEH